VEGSNAASVWFKCPNAVGVHQVRRHSVRVRPSVELVQSGALVLVTRDDHLPADLERHAVFGAETDH
jgi:hypothetical protein